MGGAAALAVVLEKVADAIREVAVDFGRDIKGSLDSLAEPDGADWMGTNAQVALAVAAIAGLLGTAGTIYFNWKGSRAQRAGPTPVSPVAPAAGDGGDNLLQAADGCRVCG